MDKEKTEVEEATQVEEEVIDSGKSTNPTSTEKSEAGEEEIEEVESSEETASEETASAEEAPTITLEVYEGPTPANGIYYYRIKAVVTGNPDPEVEFSKDDSNGAWGPKKAQVNLYNFGEVYTLTANAANSKGSDTDSIELSWGSELQEKSSEINSNSYISGLNKIYNSQEIEYFFEIAFGSEYGSPDFLLHKWVNNIRIRVNGMPTAADLDTLNKVVAELNALVGCISLSIVTDNPNLEIYFTDVSQFPSIESNYVAGNKGFSWIWWNSSDDIFNGRVLIASEGVSQQERSHLIREELTQSIGLLNDSWRYQESIFYQGWTSTPAYAPIDRSIISLLYDARLKSGMNQNQAKGALGVN